MHPPYRHYPLFRNMMYLWNELSAVADDWILLKTNLATVARTGAMHELVEICSYK